jgi:hypothetical protein
MDDTTTTNADDCSPHEHDHEHEHDHDHPDDHDSNTPGGKKRQGRPSNSLVWENVTLEQVTNDDGTTMMQQTCIHCQKVNRANKPQTTWWAVHLVDRGPKGCPNCPVDVRQAILTSSCSQQVRDAGMGLAAAASVSIPAPRGGGGGSVGKGGRGRTPVPSAPTTPGVKRGLSKLLEDNILVEVVQDGNLSQTCRHCKKNRTCKQTLATVWSKHFVDPKGCPDAPFYVRRAIAAESSSAEVKRLAESQGWFLELRRNPAAGVKEEDEAFAVDDGQKPRATKRIKSVDTCSEPLDGCCQAQADSISMKIMEFLTACGHSLLLVQSPFFIELLRSLNQAYVDRYLSKAPVFVQAWLPKLYQSVKKQLANLWNDQQRKQQCLATLGLWSHGTSAILTESLQDSHKIAFWDSVKVDDGLAEVLANHMIENAGNAGNVEAIYGAVVLAVRSAEQTGTKLQERFPKLLVNPCRLRALSKIRDGIFGIPEIAQIYSDAQLLAHFIRDHPFSRKTFAALVREKGGSLPVPAATQDFGAVHTLLESLCSKVNAECFATLIRDDGWMEISSQTVDPLLVQQFESLVAEAETFSRFRALWKLMGPLTVFAMHLERPDVRASWIYPLFEALLLDIQVWRDSQDVKKAVKKSDTFDLLTSTLRRCWRGSDGLYAPQMLLATIVDPTTCPDGDNIPDDWDTACEQVLKNFYSGKDLLDANSELMALLDRQGRFGREVERYQEALKATAPSIIEECAAQWNVQAVVERQLPSVDMKPHLVWKLSLKSSCPLLQPIARRVLVMGTSSIDSSWTKKLHDALHLSPSPVIADNKVLMLLFCHLNLRIIQDGKTDTGESTNAFEVFLGQALLAESSTEGQGQPESTETETIGCNAADCQSNEDCCDHCF